jgi:hypothetical protein
MIWAELLKNLLYFAAFAMVLWAPLGRWILARWDEKSLRNATSLPIAIGMGTWALLVLLLGVTGLLYRPVLVVLGIILFAVLRLDRYLLPRKSERDNRRMSVEQVVFIAILAATTLIYFSLVFASAFAPEMSYDALNAHLPYARDSAIAHRAGFARNNWSSMMPSLSLMSYITAFLFSNVTLAKLFNVLCYLIGGGILYWFTRRWWGGIHAATACVLFWSCPVALYEATTAMVDLPLTVFSAIAVLSLMEWIRRENFVFFWLSAISLGLALGCKYQAGFWILPLLILIWWHEAKVRMCDSRRVLALTLKYSLVAFLIFLPWLVRAYIYTGNPVFPVANNIFKSPLFPPTMDAAARGVYANIGEGFSAIKLFRLPWAVFFKPAPFHGTLGAIFFIGTLLALLRHKTPQVQNGLFCALIFFGTWAITAQEIRYLLPLLPLLAILTTAGFLGTNSEPRIESGEAGNAKWIKRLGYYGGMAAIVAGSCMAFPLIYPKLIHDWTYWHSFKSPFPYLLGCETQEEFLQRDVPSIYVFDYINKNLKAGDLVYLLGEGAVFYSHVPALYSFTVDGDSILLQETEEDLIAKLKQVGVTHVLLNYSSAVPIPGVKIRPGVYFFLDKGFVARHLAPIYARNNVALYRVGKMETRPPY